MVLSGNNVSSTSETISFIMIIIKSFLFIFFILAYFHQKYKTPETEVSGGVFEFNILLSNAITVKYLTTTILKTQHHFWKEDIRNIDSC